MGRQNRNKKAIETPQALTETTPVVDQKDVATEAAPVINPNEAAPEVQPPAPETPVVDEQKEEPKHEVVVYEAISQNMVADGLEYIENEVPLETTEEKIASLKMCYRMAVLRKFNVVMRDLEGKPIKHALRINGVDFRVKLPALLVDEQGVPTENIMTYHERVWTKAKIAFATLLKGVERIDFAPKLG